MELEKIKYEIMSDQLKDEIKLTKKTERCLLHNGKW